ncbi:hypothetical protein E1263_25065 [Kribbella antibiotica]|uniref:Tetratricopeptide repeat protein n=1 Tax=Kribbella antibiotica TaxID=190195 RepID=A0A4R4ZED4_9ACTN|nr:hypothetical protein [Kribbella antibiotica]TDD56853.1 hypothetical protein E1263_25065 [Kribbella antibiotica]
MDEEHGRQRELVAEARYQRELPKQRRQFEHALTKRSRVGAAWWLGEHCQRREPALAAAAYEYILATRPPSDHLQLFELATGLRVAGRFDASERVYRTLLADYPTDEESYLGLIAVLRSLGRAKEANAMARRHGRIQELRDLLEQAVIQAKHYHASERIVRTAPTIVDLLELDEDPRRVLWSVSLPIPQEVGFAIQTDRRLLFVQDYEYLNSGPQPGQAPEHLSCELGSTWDRQYFPDQKI